MEEKKNEKKEKYRRNIEYLCMGNHIPHKPLDITIYGFKIRHQKLEEEKEFHSRKARNQSTFLLIPLYQYKNVYPYI